MCTYHAVLTDILSETPSWEFSVNDYHIYGSSRVGTLEQPLLLYSDQQGAVIPPNPNDPLTASQIPHPLGQKRFEIANHLGNVLAVITDRKRPRAETLANGGVIQWFEADVLSSQQYYAFGMLMPDRQYSLNGYDYRFGFNGKEGDDEIKGDDNQQDYGMRIYDPRVGRFLSVDPIARVYPELAPYPFSENSPIANIDIDGLERYLVINNYSDKKISTTTISVVRDQSGTLINLQATNSSGSVVPSDVLVINRGDTPAAISPFSLRNVLSTDEQQILNAGVDDTQQLSGPPVGSALLTGDGLASAANFNFVNSFPPQGVTYIGERYIGTFGDVPVYAEKEIIEKQMINKLHVSTIPLDFTSASGQGFSWIEVRMKRAEEYFGVKVVKNAKFFLSGENDYYEKSKSYLMNQYGINSKNIIRYTGQPGRDELTIEAKTRSMIPLYVFKKKKTQVKVGDERKLIDD